MPAPGPSIGILDSGIGGFSVLSEIHRQLPDHPTLYVADQAHIPYGPRPAEHIDGFVDSITRFLIRQEAAVIVLACHAASAASLYNLRQRYPQVTFVGIEPAIKPAVERTRTGVVGVLTTQATADGPLYRRVLEQYARATRVLTRVAPELVTIAEQGLERELTSEQTLRQHIEPLLRAGADHIVLACTHFPFLSDAIRRIAGDDIELVDPGPAVARQVARVWPENAKPTDLPNRYFTTGNTEAFEQAVRRLMGVEVRAEALRLQHDGALGLDAEPA